MLALNSGSGRIIKSFLPKIVLEFTATALEDPKSDEKRLKDEIPDSEKWKLITLFLFHFLKKEAIKLCPKSSKTKPVSLVKVKKELILIMVESIQSKSTRVKNKKIRNYYWKILR